MRDIATDSEDDDRRGSDFRSLLAASAYLVLGRQPTSRDTGQHMGSRDVSRHLLAGYEQRHVQPTGLLLDEWQVLIDTDQILSYSIININIVINTIISISTMPLFAFIWTLWY